MKGFRTKQIAAFTLALSTVIMLTGCSMHYTGNLGGNFLKKEDALEFKIEKTAVEPITEISISSSIADVELIASDDYYVEIDYLYWNEEPEYTLEDGKLFFDDSDALPNSYSINFSMNNVVKIYLPENAALSSLEIENASGDVRVASFLADDVRINVSYGDFTVKDAAAITADISLSSGDSKMTDFQVSELDFSNSYGEARFTNINTGVSRLPEGTNYEKIDILMSSGDITIEGLNTDAVDIVDSYGNVTCKDITATKFDSELSSGDLGLYDADLEEIDLQSSYGDVLLRLAGSAADYDYDISTSFGKITVAGKDYEDSYSQENTGTRSIFANLSSGDIKVKFE